MLEINKSDVKKLFDFLYAGMEDYKDGRIEVSFGSSKDNSPNAANNFPVDKIDEAIDFAIKKNSEKRNVYIVGSLLEPDCVPFGRSKDEDFYASNVVWCDIDKNVNIEELKKRYENCPPSMIVVTSRHPAPRLHLWWKLDEPITDQATMIEVLTGLQQNLGGDPAVKNPTSLMRLGGLINYQTPKKLNEGRIPEYVEVQSPKNARVVTVDEILTNYPPKDYSDVDNRFHAIDTDYQFKRVGLIGEIMVDGRENYMHKLLTACIVSLTAKKGAWPTLDEVFTEAWPTYISKVGSKTGRSLEDEGRGKKAMIDKIKSKLRAFSSGRIHNARTIDEIVLSRKEELKPEIIDNFDPITGEVIEGKKSRFHYINAPDISHELDANDFVQGLLAQGAMSVVYGESNCGKTFFMTNLCFHIVDGKRWNDKRVEKGNVLYVSLEGSFGLRNRIAAYKRETGSSLDGFLMMPCAVDFTSEKEADDNDIVQLLYLVNEAKAKLGDIKLIVIDTLARAIGGGDENSGQDMGRLVKHADIIRQHSGAHICFIHHSGKDKARGARGHSSLRAAVDTEIEISRQEGADYSEVKIAKQRDMEIGEPSNFKLRSVVLGQNKYGEDVSSCVVEPYILEEDTQEFVHKKIKSGKTKTAFDALLECIMDKGTIKNNKDLPRIPVVLEDQFKEYLVRRGLLSDNLKSATVQYIRIRNDLIENNLAVYRDGYVWSNRSIN